MERIPGVRRKSVLERDTLAELFAGGLAVIGGVLSGVDRAGDNKVAWPYFACAGLILVLGGLKVWKAMRNDATREKQETPADLGGCLEVLVRAVLHAKGLSPDANHLRSTFYRVVPPAKKNQESQWVEQVIDYVGGPGGAAGRRQSIKAGIVGEAARFNEHRAGFRQSANDADFRKELVAIGFSKEEAKNISTDRYSWIAISITGSNQNECLGVVYLDAAEKDFFDTRTKELIIASCVGVTSYIKNRYTVGKP